MKGMQIAIFRKLSDFCQTHQAYWEPCPGSDLAGQEKCTQKRLRRDFLVVQGLRL